MIAVKVTCNTGNHWVTRINATFAGACQYFMGQTFVREDYNGKEIPETVVNVELITAQGR